MQSDRMATPRPPQELELLSKVNAILTAFEKAGTLSAKQLAQRTDEPVSSVYRLLASLVDMGWLERAPARGQYRLGLFFVAVGGACDERLDLLDAARPVMRRLVEQTNGSCFLLVRRGSEAVCVDRILGRGPQALALRLGDSVPLFQGAGARTLLSHLPPSVQRSELDRWERKNQWDTSIPNRSTIEFAIRRESESGYSVCDGELSKGIAEIGAPVFKHRGELLAALALHGMRSTFLSDGGQRMGILTRDAAAAVSRTLGYLPQKETHA